jgi:hypothetical protein
MIQSDERQNSDLKQLVHSLGGGKGVDTFLSSHFKDKLQNLSRRVNGAFGRLTEIEKEVKSTRVLCFGWFDDRCEKARVLGLNDRLIQHALLNERRILVARLKLRIYHDHRDVCAARRRLWQLRRREEEVTDDDTEKVRIGILKNAILSERRRITYLKSREMELHESAVVIQKHWRGFWWRFQRNRPPPIDIPHMDKVDSEDNYYSDYAESSASEPRLDSDSEPSGDEMLPADDELFSVTAVNDAALSEVGSDDEMELNSDGSEGASDEDL